MKYRTTTECIGEYLGPVDWDWFERNQVEARPEDLERLRKLETEPEKYMATTDGGWPRCGWKEVLCVGMYDGWPHWRPYPSVCLQGHFGADWHSFDAITDISEKR